MLANILRIILICLLIYIIFFDNGKKNVYCYIDKFCDYVIKNTTTFQQYIKEKIKSLEKKQDNG